VFTNPPGDHAGRLIEAVGLKGKQAGGAQVSTLHANWIVNRGGATARDVRSLMDEMRRAVHERFGVVLTAEVQHVGFRGEADR
jgi:UDP-N-acetylmuramate dehydrogenase